MKSRKQLAPRKVGTPVFVYVSTCCTEPATKPPCLRVPPKERETNSLGSWRCGKCMSPCTVTRHLNKTENTSKEVLDTEGQVPVE